MVNCILQQSSVNVLFAHYSLSNTLKICPQINQNICFFASNVMTNHCRNSSNILNLLLSLLDIKLTLRLHMCRYKSKRILQRIMIYKNCHISLAYEHMSKKSLLLHTFQIRLNIWDMTVFFNLSLQFSKPFTIQSSSNLFDYFLAK